jgi:hypothetical protein
MSKGKKSTVRKQECGKPLPEKYRKALGEIREKLENFSNSKPPIPKTRVSDTVDPKPIKR